MEQPTTFRAGDSVSWTIAIPAHAASAGWVLKYRLLTAAGLSSDITATASGDDFAVDLTAEQTATWTEGKATLVRMVEKSAQRITLGAPVVTILPNLALAANHDGRTRNEKALEDAEAALADYLAAGQMHVAEYEIAGRTMKFRSVQEIKELINHCRLSVNRDRFYQLLLTGGQPPGRSYYRG